MASSSSRRSSEKRTERMVKIVSILIVLMFIGTAFAVAVSAIVN